MLGSRDKQITLVESLVGVHFPAGHRRLLMESDGWPAQYGELSIQFLGIDEIKAAYLALVRHGPLGLDGFVTFASATNRELIGYDRRVDPSPVIMIDATATDWSQARLQGASFDNFIARLQGRRELDFGTSYAGPLAS